MQDIFFIIFTVAKYILLVLAGIASVGQFQQVPTRYVLLLPKKKKNSLIPLLIWIHECTLKNALPVKPLIWDSSLIVSLIDWSRLDVVDFLCLNPTKSPKF